MTCFEKEYKKVRASFNPTGTISFGIYLREHFKDWQPPREKVKIPQFVADWIEKHNIFDLISCGNTSWKIIAPEFDKWLGISKANAEILVNAFINGYEVEKEKLYKLNIPGLKISPSAYLAVHFGDKLACDTFTEQEIKDINERLFQFAVEVEDE